VIDFEINMILVKLGRKFCSERRGCKRHDTSSIAVSMGFTILNFDYECGPRSKTKMFILIVQTISDSTIPKKNQILLKYLTATGVR